MFNKEANLNAAEEALTNWPIKFTQIELASRSENVVYKVRTSGPSVYALRLHRPGYNSFEELNSEVNWAQALREAGIYVPKQIKTKVGANYAQVVPTDSQITHQVGLIEWLDGEPLAGLIKDSDKQQIEVYYFQLGELMAQVHNQSTEWRTPSSFVRRSWNASGLVGKNPLWGRFWQVDELDKAQVDLLSRARANLNLELENFELSDDTFGMIHADLHARNVLVNNKKLQIIDFDDCGYGWHAYELAIAEADAIGSIDGDVIKPKDIRSALVNGYKSIRTIKKGFERMLPPLAMVRHLIQLGWANDRRELLDQKFIESYISKLCPAVEEYLSQSAKPR